MLHVFVKQRGMLHRLGGIDAPAENLLTIPTCTITILKTRLDSVLSALQAKRSNESATLQHQSNFIPPGYNNQRAMAGLQCVRKRFVN